VSPRVPPPALSAAELAAALAGLPGWEVRDGRLARTTTWPSFRAAVDFVQQVADVAEELDHHPDLDLRWRTVHLSVCTHEAGGALTARDVALARRVAALLAP
jgi:4a-hydroxytetrahydrobiopterin dehydratase